MDDKNHFLVYNGEKEGVDTMEWFDTAILLVDVFVVPAILLGFGWGFMKKPPQDINGSYGYRTPASMKNQDTWEFAHQVCGRVWWRMGWLLLALSTALLAWMQTRPGGERTNWLMGILVVLAEGAALILTIIPVERALKQNFDKDGNRR